MATYPRFLELETINDHVIFVPWGRNAHGRATGIESCLFSASQSHVYMKGKSRF